MLCAVTEKRAVPDICHCIRVVHAQTSYLCALLAALKPITHNASTDSNTKTSSFHLFFFHIILFCACTMLASYFYPLFIPLYACNHTNILSSIVYLPCTLTSPALLATSCKSLDGLSGFQLVKTLHKQSLKENRSHTTRKISRAHKTEPQFDAFRLTCCLGTTLGLWVSHRGQGNSKNSPPSCSQRGRARSIIAI